MNILYDCRDKADKTPFGPVKAGQACHIRIRIPAQCGAYRVVLTADDLKVELTKQDTNGSYDIFAGAFTPTETGLYFYKFHIWDKNGDYDLYKAGDGTNMEAGDPWQLSVLPADYDPPEDYRGVVYYQIFPDRFFTSRKSCTPIPSGNSTPSCPGQKTPPTSPGATCGASWKSWTTSRASA